MSTQKYDYSFASSRRFAFGETPEQLHDHAYGILSRLPPPWGLREIPQRSLREYVGDISTGVSYTKSLAVKGGAIKAFNMGLMNRSRTDIPSDEPMNDDQLRVEFRAHKVIEPWDYLMREVFPAYVEAMGAYYAALEESHISLHDAEFINPITGDHEWKKDFIHSRIGVSRIWPANFWDRELCNRAFSLTPEEIVHRLSTKVAEVRVFRNGVLVIYSYERIPDEFVSLIDGKVRQFLVA